MPQGTAKKKKKKTKKDFTGRTYIKWKHWRVTRSRWIWVGSPCIDTEVMEVSSHLLFCAQGVLCRPVAVLMEKLPSFWPMRNKIKCRATTADEGEEDSWKGKASGQRGDPQILPGCE